MDAAPPPIIISVPADAQMTAIQIPKDWILDGEPQAKSAVLSRSADGMAVTVVWETTKGRFRWYFNIDETVSVIDGEVFVTDEKNVERRLGPGDVAYFPGGSWSTWRVPGHLRKIAFIRHGVSGPAALVARVWDWCAGWFAPAPPAASAAAKS
ncbi:MAG: cupin domain-containing protein [Rhodoblastus sp.]